MAKAWKVRAREAGGVTTVKALITHPMETGLRKDKKTGKKIPAHFIQNLSVEHNGKSTHFSVSISLPSGASGPVPAVIGLGGVSEGFASSLT